MAHLTYGFDRISYETTGITHVHLGGHGGHSLCPPGGVLVLHEPHRSARLHHGHCVSCGAPAEESHVCSYCGTSRRIID